MITSLKTVSESQNQISAALFLADHGEEIFDSKNFVGHGPDSITPTMVEIPFIIWTSEKYRQFRPAHITAMKENINEAASLDNTFHFVSHLIGIESDIINKNNSLSSERYTSRKRVVYKTDYDLKIKNGLSN
jgi:heptose-I-phosphate ethanolaminephosphotransferase